MIPLQIPWLELAVLVPLAGALWIARLRDADRARRWCLAVSAVVLGCTLGAWVEFAYRAGAGSVASWSYRGAAMGPLSIDEFSVPLLPLTAGLYLMTSLATLRTKVRRFSFAWALLSEGILLATLASRQPWAISVLLVCGMVPPYLELRTRRKPTGVYLWHMGACAGLLVLGTVWASDSPFGPVSAWVVAPLLIGVLIRSGCVPLHCWMTDLFEHATFGTALLFVAPIAGAYALVRLVLPVAPEAVLRTVGMLSLVTACYAAGMALVQREARRFFCYLFLSHSALVFVGLESVSPIGLSGGLCTWMSISLGLTGLGLTLRALESRYGRMSLDAYQGGYVHKPILAICFLLTGLASVGFPGTIGFVGTEMLVDGAVHTYPYVGAAVVLVAALNGIAVMRAYFVLFTGTRHKSSVPLGITARERIAVLALAAAILAGGLFPQPWVASRHHAAIELLRSRGITLLAGRPHRPQASPPSVAGADRPSD